MNRIRKHVNAENIIMFIIAAASVYMFFTSFGFRKAQSKLFPQIVSGLTFGCSVAGLIINCIKSSKVRDAVKSGEEIKETEKKHGLFQHLPNHYLVMIVTVIYIVLLEPLGFVISSALVLLVLPVLLGYRKWYVVLPVALVLSIGLYVLFKDVFYVYLPAGLLKSIM